MIGLQLLSHPTDRGVPHLSQPSASQACLWGASWPQQSWWSVQWLRGSLVYHWSCTMEQCRFDALVSHLSCMASTRSVTHANLHHFCVSLNLRTTYNWQRISEHLGVWFSKQLCVSIPASSINKQSFDIDTIFRRLTVVTIFKNIKVETK